MKTKLFITIISGLLLFTGNVTGQQTYYYTTTKTITGNGFVYKCDNPYGRVTLYNINNKFTYVDWANKDGSPIEEGVHYGDIGTIESDWAETRADIIIDSIFTSQEKVLVRGHRFVVAMYVDTATGKVCEVNFSFSSTSPFGLIEPKTYYAIEQALKREIWYTVTPTGRKLNYGISGWIHTVK